MAKLTLNRKMIEHCVVCGGQGILAGLRPCQACYGTGIARVRCAQCMKWKVVGNFLGKRVPVTKNCHECQDRMADWAKLDLAQREGATNPRASIKSDGDKLYFKFVNESQNRKTGPIPVTMTSANSCPKSCAYYGRGCYAEAHILAIHWRRVSSGDGIEWTEFLRRIWKLPKGTLWRHNEAGDLPGDGDKIDFNMGIQLCRANDGKRGFTYTHRRDLNMIRTMNGSGFTVNLSADSIDEAERYFKEGVPVTVVLPYDAPAKRNQTKGGVPIVVCPAQLADHVTCKSCEICAVSKRKFIVGFRAHGDRKKQITERIGGNQLRLPMFGEASPPSSVG